jgi:hypothetical protein
MTKSELIAWLEGIPGEPEVLIWDPEAEEWLPITGGTYDVIELKLYSDDRDDDDE